MVYHIPKARPDGPRSLALTPLELLDQIAAPVSPRVCTPHRYYGVLARMRTAGTFRDKSERLVMAGSRRLGAVCMRV